MESEGINKVTIAKIIHDLRYLSFLQRKLYELSENGDDTELLRQMAAIKVRLGGQVDSVRVVCRGILMLGKALNHVTPNDVFTVLSSARSPAKVDDRVAGLE